MTKHRAQDKGPVKGWSPFSLFIKRKDSWVPCCGLTLSLQACVSKEAEKRSDFFKILLRKDPLSPLCHFTFLPHFWPRFFDQDEALDLSSSPSSRTQTMGLSHWFDPLDKESQAQEVNSSHLSHWFLSDFSISVPPPNPIYSTSFPIMSAYAHWFLTRRNSHLFLTFPLGRETFQ